LNAKIITQPAKFCRVPDRAKPIASQAAANIATKELVSTQIIPAALIITMIFNMIAIRLDINDSNIRSHSFFSIIVVTILLSILTILKPIHNTKSAQIIFGTISAEYLIIIFSNPEALSMFILSKFIISEINNKIYNTIVSKSY